MKLSLIAEAGLKSKTAIRDTAAAVGELIDFIYKNGNPEHKKAMDDFLKAPDAKGWEQSKWLIDQAMQMATKDPAAQGNLKTWDQLKGMSSPVVAAAVYDIDPKQAKGTPLQGVTFGKGVRDKYKLALGPQGYVSTMANVDDIGTNKLRDMLKAMSKDGTAIAKAAQKDIPSIRPVQNF